MTLSEITKNVYCKRVSVTSPYELAETITRTDWSPGIFKEDYRNESNFESEEIIGLDFDDHLTLEGAKIVFAEYKHIIATTRNHQKEKNGKICDRFRVILWLNRIITSVEEHRATWKTLASKFSGLDESAKDPSRMFYKSVEIVSLQESGEAISVTTLEQKGVVPKESVQKVKGQLARSTFEFQKNGAEDGRWNSTLYKAARDYHQNGYSYGEAIALLEKSTEKFDGSLDSQDLATIKSAYSKTPMFPPRFRYEFGRDDGHGNFKPHFKDPPKSSSPD